MRQAPVKTQVRESILCNYLQAVCKRCIGHIHGFRFLALDPSFKTSQYPYVHISKFDNKPSSEVSLSQAVLPHEKEF